MAEKTELLLQSLEAVAAGRMSLAQLAGLSNSELGALRRLAERAEQAEQFAKAARLWAGLEALEPHQLSYLLRRALAESQAGQDPAALQSISRYLETEGLKPREQLVKAFRLRASLLLEHDPAGAEADQTAARLIESELK